MTSTAYYNSPIGWLEVTASEIGIRSIRKHVPEKMPENPKQGIALTCIQQLKEYFEGKREEFDLDIDFTGYSDFNRAVWDELLNIPFGRTTSYSAIAEKLNNPKAVRAVGLANRNNPIAIVVPCHRVIAKSGKLQGYFYGLEIKRQLLELENPSAFARQGSLF